MKEILKQAFIILLNFIFLYLIYSFIELDLNFLEWSKDDRQTMIIFSCYSIIITLFYYNIFKK